MDIAQYSAATLYDRHPEIFRAARTCLSGIEKPRILSFGCSHGHELATLRGYFPNAEIFGCDVQEDALENAKSLNIGTVFQSTEGNIVDYGPFDAIFAMSVLCFHPPIEDVKIPDVFPFAAFESLCLLLDSALDNEGYLFVVNSSYQVMETKLGRAYSRISCEAIPNSGFVDLYSRNGDPVDRADMPYCIFQKAVGVERTIIADQWNLPPRPDLPPVATSPAQRRRAKKIANRIA